ncbi:LuxR C-terminal-related transcriptional regulator [Streptomyces sp. NBC_00388]|uniref:LuxR C-terminal-related transcriptional regulator n=1 Tax=Streptomyces sp. NBC_00388 TaxID=2975735 RepID=UPI002E1DB300
MSERAHKELLDLAVEVIRHPRPHRLGGLISARVLHVLDAEYGINKNAPWTEDAGELHVWSPAGQQDGLLQEENRRSLRAGYPFVDFYNGRPSPGPQSARQIENSRAWRNSVTRTVIRETFGACDALALPLPLGTAHTQGWLVYRSGTPFGAADLAYACVAQPLLSAVHRHLNTLGQCRDLPARALHFGLTPRECTVLHLLSMALTAAAIAHHLGISVRTVHKHLASLYQKLGTSDRLETVLRAQRLGILPREPNAGP